jgi:hypothetical protein
MFASGSPNGSEIVAVLAPAGTAEGALALFSATTGAQISTIAIPPAGTGYSAPQFSPDGSQVVFESDPISSSGTVTGPSSIDLVNVDGSGLRTIAQGTSPFWGGTASSSGGGGGSSVPPAPKVHVTVPRQRLATIVRLRHLSARCTVAGRATCTVTVAVDAATAYRLKLATDTLGSASRLLRKRGSARVTIALPAKIIRAVRRVRSLQVTVTGISTAPGHSATSAVRTVTLR